MDDPPDVADGDAFPGFIDQVAEAGHGARELIGARDAVSDLREVTTNGDGITCCRVVQDIAGTLSLLSGIRQGAWPTRLGSRCGRG